MGGRGVREGGAGAGAGGAADRPERAWWTTARRWWRRESVESWSEVLRDLRERGMPAPRLVIGDGHLGI